jgi:hypothetical protein
MVEKGQKPTEVQVFQILWDRGKKRKERAFLDIGDANAVESARILAEKGFGIYIERLLDGRIAITSHDNGDSEVHRAECLNGPQVLVACVKLINETYTKVFPEAFTL